MASEPENGASNGPLLGVDGVFKRFGGIHAVNGASFQVPPASITALIGPNGAGKTTLFNVLTGFYRGDRGAITFDGSRSSATRPTRSPSAGWSAPSRSRRRWRR